MSNSVKRSETSDGMMLTRRAVCLLGVGLTAVAVPRLLGSSFLGAGDNDIRYVVTDRRYPQSLEFGAILTGQGVRRLEVTEGLTALWREALVPLWQGKGGLVAGITQRGTWACLAEQARGCGRKSVLVGQHVVGEADEATAHLVSVRSSALSAAAALERCGSAWPRVMADLAVHYPTHAHHAPDACYRSAAGTTAASAHALTSWIIA